VQRLSPEGRVQCNLTESFLSCPPRTSVGVAHAGGAQPAGGAAHRRRRAFFPPARCRRGSAGRRRRVESESHTPRARAAALAASTPAINLASHQRRILNRALSVTQRALRVTQQALSVTQRALSVTQRALSVTQRDLTVTQQPLSVTQRALGVTQRALSVTQPDLSVTQLALSVTQQALSVNARLPLLCDTHDTRSHTPAGTPPPPHAQRSPRQRPARKTVEAEEKETEWRRHSGG
jgi:hypothetical protein